MTRIMIREKNRTKVVAGDDLSPVVQVIQIRKVEEQKQDTGRKVRIDIVNQVESREAVADPDKGLQDTEVPRSDAPLGLEISTDQGDLDPNHTSRSM